MPQTGNPPGIRLTKFDGVTIAAVPSAPILFAILLHERIATAAANSFLLCQAGLIVHAYSMGIEFLTILGSVRNGHERRDSGHETGPERLKRGGDFS
jgi:hypothetical protein